MADNELTTSDFYSDALGLPEGMKSTIVEKDERVSQGWWTLNYRRAGETWIDELIRGPKQLIRITNDDWHPDDFVGEAIHSGKEQFGDDWVAGFAVNLDDGTQLGFGLDPVGTHEFLKHMVDKGFDFKLLWHDQLKKQDKKKKGFGA